jgi:hypothetical protein
VILLGATSPWLLCQLAPSRITTAWASAATWLLISQRWWFIAAVLQIGIISAADLCKTRDTATGMNKVMPSATLQWCNTFDQAAKFGRLWQQLHHFEHRITKDDPRRPTLCRFPGSRAEVIRDMVN